MGAGSAQTRGQSHRAGARQAWRRVLPWPPAELPPGPQLPVCGTRPGQRLTSSPAPPHVCADPPHPPRSRGTPPSPEQDLVSATARVDATALSVSRRRGAGSGAGPSVYGTSLGSGQPDVRPSARHGEGPRPEPQPGPSGGSLALPSGTHAHSTRTGAVPSPAERRPQPSSVDVLQ